VIVETAEEAERPVRQRTVTRLEIDPPSEQDLTDGIAFLWWLRETVGKGQSALHFTDLLINTLKHT